MCLHIFLVLSPKIIFMYIFCFWQLLWFGLQLMLIYKALGNKILGGSSTINQNSYWVVLHKSTQSDQLVSSYFFCSLFLRFRGWVGSSVGWSGSIMRSVGDRVCHQWHSYSKLIITHWLNGCFLKTAAGKVFWIASSWDSHVKCVLVETAAFFHVFIQFSSLRWVEEKMYTTNFHWGWS